LGIGSGGEMAIFDYKGPSHPMPRSPVRARRRPSHPMPLSPVIARGGNRGRL